MSEQMKMDAERASFESWVASEKPSGCVSDMERGWQARASLPVSVTVAHQILRKNADGKWVNDGRKWLDGAPAEALVAYIAKRTDQFRLELAYAAPTIKAEQVPAARTSLIAELRKAAGEIASAGHFGWGNAMAAAADALEAPSLPAAVSAGVALGEVEIPDIVATFDGLYLVPIKPLQAGDHLMTTAQCLRIMEQLRAAHSAQQAGAVSVPRDLLADLISQDHDTRIQAERGLIALLSKRGGV